MSSQKKARGLMKEGPLVQMLEGPLVQMLDRRDWWMLQSLMRYEVIIMDDSLRKLLPDLVILIEIEGVQWLETATCERGFSLRTQILTAHRHSMGDSLLACLIVTDDDLLQRPIVA